MEISDIQVLTMGEGVTEVGKERMTGFNGEGAVETLISFCKNLERVIYIPLKGHLSFLPLLENAVTLLNIRDSFPYFTMFEVRQQCLQTPLYR